MLSVVKCWGSKWKYILSPHFAFFRSPHLAVSCSVYSQSAAVSAAAAPDLVQSPNWGRDLSLLSLSLPSVTIIASTLTDFCHNAYTDAIQVGKGRRGKAKRAVVEQ